MSRPPKLSALRHGSFEEGVRGPKGKPPQSPTRPSPNGLSHFGGGELRTAELK